MLALGGAAAGVLSLPLAVVAVFLANDANDATVLALAGLFVLGAAAVVTGCGVAAVVRVRRSDGWLFGLRAAVFAALLYPLLFANLFVLVPAEFLDAEYPYILGSVLAALAVVGVNAWVVRHTWKLITADRKRVAPPADED
jgi:hypothetical protein